MIGGCNFMPGKRDKARRIPMRDVAKLTPDQLKRRQSFLELYRKHKALLRFNQLFNIYIRAENIDTGTVDAYRGLMQPIVEYFHVIYEKAKQDGTVRTDVSETEILSTTIHLMLAAVTRYAVGLVYQPERGFDAQKELGALKELLFSKYAVP